MTLALSWCSARLRSGWPGLALCAVIALAASYLAAQFGGPVFLYALCFGLAFHFLAEDARCAPGVALCSSSLLRLGVALLGARITLDQIGALGVETLAVVAGAVCSTIALGWLLARACGGSAEEGVLSGGAVAICGASAALAIAAVLPHNRRNEHYTLMIVVGVTTLSTVAMLAYPLLSAALGLDARAAGIFIGGSIHDVAQVVGAGYLLSAHTGDVATVVKLARVICLVPAVCALAWLFGGRLRATDAKTPGHEKKREGYRLPLFLLGFVALVALNSGGVLSPSLQQGLSELSRACLVLAIAALGVKTSFQSLRALGWRPLILLLVESAWIALWVLVAVMLMA